MEREASHAWADDYLKEVLDQLADVSYGAVDVLPQEALAQKLASGRQLKIKLGVDPTSPDLHLGHAVPLRKMRQFQDMGHIGVLVIGNGTALIGDPSGRNSTRPTLSSEEIEANTQTYVEQAFKVLDKDKTKVVYNADWIKPLDLSQILKLMSSFTVARILERDDFSRRHQAHAPISLHEFIYPVLQAYDSVVIKADVELGGTDQIFNLLAGRDLMEREGLEPQVALTTPLLVGTDGTKKMSKSYGNYIGLTDAPADIYGKVMSIPDELLGNYYLYASSFDAAHVRDVVASLEARDADPYALKRALAENIVSTYYDADAARDASKHFDALFKEHQRPEAPQVPYTPELNDGGTVYLPALLVACKLAQSNSEARRLIQGGGVKVNDKQVRDINIAPEDVDNAFVQVGKRKAVQLVRAR